MSTATALMTAEEYAKMADSDRPTELVQGRVVEGNFPPPQHGYVCCNAAVMLGTYVRENELGRVVVNGGLITEREPDTVRGPDVWYASYRKMPQGRVPDFYLEIAPDLVFEVRSTDDRWSGMLGRVAEFLELGVPVVCVLDPEQETAHVFHPDEPSSQNLSADDELTFPEVLPGFSVRVGSLFE